MTLKDFYLSFASVDENGTTLLQHIHGEQSQLVVCPLSFLETVEVNFCSSHVHWLTELPGPHKDQLSDFSLCFNSNFISYEINEKNCAVSLEEMYKVKGGKILSVLLGTWSPSSGLDVPVPHKWRRRNNLGGAMHGFVKNDWPAIFAAPPATTSSANTSGILTDVLDMLQARLNFTVGHVMTEDDEYGAVNSDGTWSGLIGQLHRHDIDLSAAGLTITRDRSVVA